MVIARTMELMKAAYIKITSETFSVYVKGVLFISSARENVE